MGREAFLGQLDLLASQGLSVNDPSAVVDHRDQKELWGTRGKLGTQAKFKIHPSSGPC